MRVSSAIMSDLCSELVALILESNERVHLAKRMSVTLDQYLPEKSVVVEELCLSDCDSEHATDGNLCEGCLFHRFYIRNVILLYSMTDKSIHNANEI